MKKSHLYFFGEESVYPIDSLQPENRKQMDAHDFSRGAKIKPGDMSS